MTDSNQNSKLTPSEQYIFALANDEPNYYATIPAILYYSTYLCDVYEKNEETGEKEYKHTERKKLSPHAIALYGYIRQLAGKRDKEWAGRDHLAKMTGMSASMITNAKKELSSKIEQLNGKSFIDIHIKPKRSVDQSGKNQQTTYHEIHVTNVWGENNAYMETREHQVELPLGIVHNSTAMSQCDTAEAPMSQYDTASLGAMSQYDTNKNQCNKNHSDKESEAVASPPDLSLSSSNNFTDSMTNTGYIADEIQQTRDKLRRIGCDESFINYAMKTYTVKEINAAGYKMRQKIEAGETIHNKIGYFRRILENPHDKY